VCVCSGAGILNCLDACSATGAGGGLGTGGTGGTSGGYDCDAICEDAGSPGDPDCLSGCEEACPAPPTECEACLCSGAGLDVCTSICEL
jgi:hypothetical protein